MPAQWQSEPKRWRVRGTSPTDGMTVTLGRYDTEQEVEAARDTFVREGVYRDVKVEAIILPPDPAPNPSQP